MTGLGYRQRHILTLFEARAPLRVGFMCRQLATDGKTVNMALRGLAARGMVRRVGYGVWERV